MKNLVKIILCFIFVFSFSLNVYAASSSITVSKTGDELEYINGLKINENKASSYKIYVLDKDTYFDSKKTLKNPVLADSGISYIINNSDVTSNSDRNYYITQVAILWYQDVLNGNDNNISSEMKTYIKNNTKKTECYYINKLVNGAIEYSKSSNLLNIVTEDITFSKEGSYYYSNEIEVESYNLKSNPVIKLYNDPKNTDIIEEDLTKDGISTFKIKVPVKSLEEDIIDFELNVTGKVNDDNYYQYDNVIYSRKYTDTINVNDNMIVSIEEFKTTYVRIEVIDNDGDYISGLNFKVYSGDCTNTTCSSKNLVHSFTTKSVYTTLSNKLTYGTYTVVLSSKTKYDLPEKTLIEVLNIEDTQKFIIKETGDNVADNEDVKDDNTNDKDIVNNKNIYIYNDIKDKNNTLSIYDIKGNLAHSYSSDNNPYNINLSVGEYYIIDSNNLLDKVYFMITSSDELMVKVNGIYVSANYITLNKIIFEDVEDDDLIVDDNINNNDNVTDNNSSNNNYYVDENGNIHIDNIDGIDSIEITNKVETNTDVEINWLDKVVDCPTTSLSSSLKYIIGAIILSTGLYLVIRNVKRSKNNI
ncbi:MAG: hypothetical protein IJD92_03195 [Bacilli bacterium]|nr:hypothetical protein [Bacilli bacterium]